MSLIISGTTNTPGIELASSNNPVFVEAGAYVFGTLGTGLYGNASSPAWTITNSGQIDATKVGISLERFPIKLHHSRRV